MLGEAYVASVFRQQEVPTPQSPTDSVSLTLAILVLISGVMAFTTSNIRFRDDWAKRALESPKNRERVTIGRIELPLASERDFERDKNAIAADGDVSSLFGILATLPFNGVFR